MSNLTLHVILTVAGVGSILLVAFSAIALLRRRSWSYLLVTLAVGTLVLRTFLGVVLIGDFITNGMHHTLEHSLDVLVVGLLFGAVYFARTVRPPDDLDYDRFEEDPHD